MIYVGIDVAKDKHDCFICNGDGEVLANVFTIENSKSGFEHLLSIINTCTGVDGKKKVGLEATGHYSYNLLGFLLDNGLPTYVINPLHTMKGYAIILISSEMPEILGMSDRIVVMCNGKVSGELKRGEATQEAILELAMEKSAPVQEGVANNV